MSDPKKLFVGEIGKQIRVNTGVSLDGMTEGLMYIEKPDGTTAVSWTGAALGAVANGILNYTTLSGDLNVQGIYRLYVKLTFAGGKVYYGEKTSFMVFSPSEG